MGETLLWATDVHLDHLPHPESARRFGEALRQETPLARGLILTGDIAGARSIEDVLLQLQAGFAGPVYFVLGNHDYYRGRFGIVDDQIKRLAAGHPDLVWLRFASARINPSVALVGTCGWYDVRYGNPDSPLQMSDFMQIGEVLEALDDSRASMHRLFQARADMLARGLEADVRSLLHDPHLKEILVATHVPPFAESCWYKGEAADGTWTPYFASKATGDALLRLAHDYPQILFTTLCGHTHSEGLYEAADNLLVYTGRATYGAPDLAGTLTLSPALQVDLARSPEKF